MPCVNDFDSRAACVVDRAVAAFRIDARSPVANRPWIAATPSAWSTSAVPAILARVTASAIFTFIRAVPAAAASMSQARAP